MSYLPAKARYYKPGSMIRTNMPTVTADHAVLPYDHGCVIGAAGITVTLPLINPTMQGEEYVVRNLSNGIATVTPASGNFILDIGLIQKASMPIQYGESLSFKIETDTNCWYYL